MLLHPVFACVSLPGVLILANQVAHLPQHLRLIGVLDHVLFATVVLGYIAAAPGGGLRVRVSLGGHPPPLVLRADGTIETPGSYGVLLGMIEEPTLYDSDFTTLFNAAQTIAGTTPVSGLAGTTIITGIVNNGTRQTIAWQRRSPSATYNSVFGTSFTLSPRIAFYHDVNGISPGPGGGCCAGLGATGGGASDCGPSGC